MEPALREGLWVNPPGIHETAPALRTAVLRRYDSVGGSATDRRRNHERIGV
jgi:hypothetical protein